MEQINSEINKLEIKIRKKICDFDSQQNDLNFASIYKNILNLWSIRKQLLNELNDQIIKIKKNDLIQLNKVIEFNRSKLNNASFLKEFSKLVDELETIHRHLNECVQHDRDKQYDQFVTKIRLTDNSIRQLQESLEKNCYSFDNKMYEIFSKEMNSILKKMAVDRDNLTKKVNYDLKHIWDQNLVIWKQDDEKLIINFDCKLRTNTNQLSEYLHALDKNYLLEHLTNNLGKQLIDSIINTILNKETTLDDFEILSVDNYDTLRIKFVNQQTDLYNGELIFQCVSTLIRFLQMIFESNQLVLKYLNPKFKKIFKLLNEVVLNQLLPSRESELPNFINYVKKIEQLQNEAIESGCLHKDDALSFSTSINLNFVNKLCYRYLIKGRKIVKKDLLPVKDVGTNYLVENRKNTETDISQTLYSFPKCKISVSLDEFVEVLKEIINEIKTGNIEHRKDLFLTARKFCELYTDVSLIKHEKKLNECISQAAIFHNNCFYLAHELVKLGNDIIFTEEYQEEEFKEVKGFKEDKLNDIKLEKDKIDKNDDNNENLDTDGWNLDEEEQLNLDYLNLNEDIKLDEDLNKDDNLNNKDINKPILGQKNELNKKNANVSLNLVDFIPLLRDLGSDHLLNQMKKQKKLILDILQDSKTMQNLVNDHSVYKGDPNNHPLHRAISQVLDKIFSLREEILEILPRSVTISITCTFLNTLIQEVFHKILKIEDIPECNCSILLSALTYIEEFLNDRKDKFNFIEDFLVSKEENLTIVQSDYYKLVEMKFVLTANLQEISDRWDHGLLTRAFTSDQLKHMIRALFQNTERRSALLSKISNKK